MKKILLLTLTLTISLIMYAQDFSKVKPNTVWYINGDKLEQIFYIQATGGKSNLGGVKLVFDEPTSGRNLSKQEFYLYINTEEGESPNNIGIIPLVVKNSKRMYKLVSGGLFGASSGDVIKMNYKQVADNVFCFTPKSPLTPGEYGLFNPVNKAKGIRGAIYDFTVVNK